MDLLQCQRQPGAETRIRQGCVGYLSQTEPSGFCHGRHNTGRCLGECVHLHHATRRSRERVRAGSVTDHTEKVSFDRSAKLTQANNFASAYAQCVDRSFATSNKLRVSIVPQLFYGHNACVETESLGGANAAVLCRLAYMVQFSRDRQILLEGKKYIGACPRLVIQSFGRHRSWMF